MTEAVKTEEEVWQGSADLAVLAYLLIGLGAVGSALAFFFSVEVSTGLTAYGAPSHVANVDRLALRSMILACGLAVFVSGWIVLGASKIRDAILK